MSSQPESSEPDLKKLKDAAMIAALSYITDCEQADNFRHPDKLRQRQAEGIPTASITLNDGLPREEALKMLDAVAISSQEAFRLAVQKLVLTEQPAQESARQIESNVFKQTVRKRSLEILAEVAKSMGHETPSLGQGVL